METILLCQQISEVGGLGDHSPVSQCPLVETLELIFRCFFNFYINSLSTEWILSISTAHSTSTSSRAPAVLFPLPTSCPLISADHNCTCISELTLRMVRQQRAWESTGSKERQHLPTQIPIPIMVELLKIHDHQNKSIFRL